LIVANVGWFWTRMRAERSRLATVLIVRAKDHSQSILNRFSPSFGHCGVDRLTKNSRLPRDHRGRGLSPLLEGHVFHGLPAF